MVVYLLMPVATIWLYHQPAVHGYFARHVRAHIHTTHKANGGQGWRLTRSPRCVLCACVLFFSSPSVLIVYLFVCLQAPAVVIEDPNDDSFERAMEGGPVGRAAREARLKREAEEAEAAQKRQAMREKARQ